MKSRWPILVVDDDEAMTAPLAARLRADGYSVDAAASGQEAIEMARARAYAIYFVDLEVPGDLDGVETMMEIRKTRRDAAVIIITARATVDTAIAAMKAIERALVARKGGALAAEDSGSLKRPAVGAEPAEAAAFPLGLTLQELEKRYLAATLVRLSGNVKAAAESLGIDRSTLYEKIKRYEIPR